MDLDELNRNCERNVGAYFIMIALLEKKSMANVKTDHTSSIDIMLHSQESISNIL